MLVEDRLFFVISWNRGFGIEVFIEDIISKMNLYAFWGHYDSNLSNERSALFLYITSFTSNFLTKSRIRNNYVRFQDTDGSLP